MIYHASSLHLKAVKIKLSFPQQIVEEHEHVRDEYGLEIPQTHGSTNPRIGRKLDKRERKYGGTQSRNTNKSLIYVPTTNCIPSKWVR